MENSSKYDKCCCTYEIIITDDQIIKQYSLSIPAAIIPEIRSLAANEDITLRKTDDV